MKNDAVMTWRLYASKYADHHIYLGDHRCYQSTVVILNLVHTIFIQLNVRGGEGYGV